MEKQYLGDGVYAAVEMGMLKLTTEDGVSVQNEIYLEPEVFMSLLCFGAEAFGLDIQVKAVES